MKTAPRKGLARRWIALPLAGHLQEPRAPEYTHGYQCVRVREFVFAGQKAGPERSHDGRADDRHDVLHLGAEAAAKVEDEEVEGIAKALFRKQVTVFICRRGLESTPRGLGWKQFVTRIGS